MSARPPQAGAAEGPHPVTLIDAAEASERLAAWAGIEAARRRWEADVRLARDAGMSIRAIARAAGCATSRIQRLLERR